ncbi:hypothetical protein [Agathobaculum desmolans]|uniref:hypothetical protein n=1 Tax=Agathobaculum desmolans TaxID=39484 RepID=UPI0012B5069E|nr:hypothetical protein [Agathobaculum desmolans]
MAKQLAKAAFGWMDPLAPFLAVIYRIEKRKHLLSLFPQVVLAHPPHRFSFFSGSLADVI